MHSVADLTAHIVPARFADRTLAGYHTETPSQMAALDAAERLVSETYLSLALVGPPGVGKSHLAAGVVNAIVAREAAGYAEKVSEAEETDLAYWPRLPVSPMWTNVADLIVGLRMQMDYPLDDRDAASAVRQLRAHPALVVLDDLGREKASDWTGEIVYSLVNARYENRLPTLVTSNLSPTELAASPYWPAVSRLAEDGALVKIEGRDRRLPS